MIIAFMCGCLLGVVSVPVIRALNKYVNNDDKITRVNAKNGLNGDIGERIVTLVKKLEAAEHAKKILNEQIENLVVKLVELEAKLEALTAENRGRDANKEKDNA